MVSLRLTAKGRKGDQKWTWKKQIEEESMKVDAGKMHFAYVIDLLALIRLPLG